MNLLTLLLFSVAHVGMEVVVDRVPALREICRGRTMEDSVSLNRLKLNVSKAIKEGLNG
jgi:hypothetical protein